MSDMDTGYANLSKIFFLIEDGTAQRANLENIIS